MQMLGLKPDHGIYTGLLTAYSHACNTEAGLACFESMKRHGLRPRLEHYNSMIILLSHAGTLNEAGELAQTMPLVPYTTEWTALLGACRAHGDINLASRCFDKAAELEPNIASGYVLMSSMYADDLQAWGDAEKWEPGGALHRADNRDGSNFLCSSRSENAIQFFD
jgi:pentatricopeptide repeat protein